MSKGVFVTFVSESKSSGEPRPASKLESRSFTLTIIFIIPQTLNYAVFLTINIVRADKKLNFITVHVCMWYIAMFLSSNSNFLLSIPFEK